MEEETRMEELQAVVNCYSSALLRLFFTIRISTTLPVKPDLADFLPEMLQYKNYWCNQKAGTGSSQKGKK